MVTISIDGIKKIEVEVKYSYAFIELEHSNGARSKLEVPKETAKLLKEKLNEKSEL